MEVQPATRYTAKHSSTKQPLPTTLMNHSGPARTTFVFTDCADVLTEMLSRLRVSMPLISNSWPQVSLSSFITAYDNMLLSMPKAMLMSQHSVRCHIVWKRALAASAVGHIKFNKLNSADIELMSFDCGSTSASLCIPSWLSFHTLAAQVRSPVELLCMWVSLWQAALVLDSAETAMSKNAAGINQLLMEYLTHHSHSPSPRTLMLRHMQLPEGSEAHIDIVDAGHVPAKRHCPPRVGAKGHTAVPVKRADS